MKRYEAVHGASGAARDDYPELNKCVLEDEDGLRNIVAHCSSAEMASRIADALNALRWFDPKWIKAAAGRDNVESVLHALAHPEGYHVS